MSHLGLLLLFLFGFSCDFTPRLNKKILVAQDYIFNNQYEKAVKEYEEILKLSPPLDIKVKIFYQLGQLHSINLADNKKAVVYFKKIKKTTKDRTWQEKSNERMGEIHYSLFKDYAESIKNYDSLTSFKPRLNKYDFYSYRLALSYLGSKKYSKAQEIFQEIKANKESKYSTISSYYLGVISFEKKQWKLAIKEWESYLKSETDQKSIVRVKFLIANAYETMEELKKAYNIYYSILSEYPNTDVVKNRLESIYERRVARKR